VQTLSRLNRAYPEKETYVLDFVNEAADILDAFKTYYQTAELSDVTDPNLVYNLRAKLDNAGYYDEVRSGARCCRRTQSQRKTERTRRCCGTRRGSPPQTI